MVETFVIINCAIDVNNKHDVYNNIGQAPETIITNAVNADRKLNDCR